MPKKAKIAKPKTKKRQAKPKTKKAKKQITSKVKLKSSPYECTKRIRVDPALWQPADGFAKVMLDKEGRFTSNPYFHRCREDFHRNSKRLRWMLFAHDPCEGPSVAAFIARIEEKLGVEPKTLFGETNRSTVTWIKVSRWWTQPMRRSLFTALLRSGRKYRPSKRWAERLKLPKAGKGILFGEKDNFMPALWSCNYLNGTRKAVLRFLAGHTTYTGKTVGWYQQFNYELLYSHWYGRPKLSLKKLLV